MSSSQPKQSWTADITPYLLYLTAVATLGPLQFGFHLAELNAPEKVIRCIDHTKSAASASTLPSIPNCIPMDAPSFAVVSSIYTLGGLFGALSSGPLSSRYGRLLPLRLASIFFVLGPLVSSLAPTIPVMAIGRFLSGIGSGAAVVVVPIYISEIAPPQSKGMFGALTQVGTNIGILLTQVLGFFLSYGWMWRIVLGVAGGIAVVQAVGLLGVVESPQWLATKERVGFAKKVLRRIRGESSIEEEVGKWASEEDDEEEEYEHLLSEQSNNSRTPKNKSHAESIGILQVIVHSDHYKAIIAVIGVMLAQQLCGINAVIMYSVSFLSDILPTAAGLITVAVGGLNLVVTIACAPLADRLGRKTCLLLSIVGMGTNSLLLACAIVFDIKILSAAATLLMVASFAVGLGPIPFILASELVGPEAVGATQSWALAANWTATFLVAQFFPILNVAMGKGRVFFVFTGMAVLFFAFVTYWVPETNGRSADEAWGRADRVRRED